MTIDPATSLGPVTLTVGDLDAPGGLLPAGNRPPGDGPRRRYRRAGRPRGRRSAHPAPRAPRRAPASTPYVGAVPSRRARSLARRAGPRAAPGDERGLSPHRRVRPSRLGGALPRRPRGQRDRDLPRPAAGEWEREQGELRMATLPLDLEGVLASAPAGEAPADMPAGTTIGHVHLQVGVDSGRGRLLRRRARLRADRARYPGALFVSAGGYHHHVGLNTWAGEGVPPPPPGARGLHSFTVVLPDAAALEATRAAVTAAGVEATPEDGGFSVVDPSGNRAVLVHR